MADASPLYERRLNLDSCHYGLDWAHEQKNGKEEHIFAGEPAYGPVDPLWFAEHMVRTVARQRKKCCTSESATSVRRRAKV
jgi:hypothetical protein